MIVYRKKHTNTNCNATFYIFYLKVSYVKIFYKVLFRFVQKKLFIKKLGSDKHTNLYENVNRSKYAFMAFKYNELWKLPANMVVVSKEEVEKNLPEKSWNYKKFKKCLTISENLLKNFKYDLKIIKLN